MKAIKFKEVNLQIAENQEEYETLPAKIDIEDPAAPTTMCIELNQAEINQVVKTGMIWLTVLTFMRNFQPIKMSLLKPGDCTSPAALRKYFIYQRDGSIVVYKTKGRGKKRGSLLGEFLGRETDKPCTSKNRGLNFEEGEVGTMHDGSSVEVVEPIYFID